jgi:putative transposase
MGDKRRGSSRVRWARFRFEVIGHLLAAPPDPGELDARIEELSRTLFTHPTTGKKVTLAFSTIERWYYCAKNHPTDPAAALARKVHANAGTHPSVGPALATAIAAQHDDHPSWSYDLHYTNLVALAKRFPELGEVPSLATVTRYMKDHGLLRQKKRKKRKKDPLAPEAPIFEARERRSFEVGHVHALWHSDFHAGSRRVVDDEGVWHTPVLLAFLDDHSRIVCHAQWFLHENSEAYVHALIQAICKRGLPRSLLSDNGGPMTCAEVTEGLPRLSVMPYTTLPYCPEQNGKQESFWGQVEGRLLAMLEGEPMLTLELLNRATQAWVEHEYHRRLQSEIGTTPLDRLLNAPNVGRPSPSVDVLRRAFRREVSRTQRRSDGTIAVEGVRFEMPSRFRPLTRPTIRYASWDLSNIDLVDPRHETHLATLLPLDKLKNATGARRVVTPVDPRPAPASGIAAHLDQLMREYAATGLPPAYVSLDERRASDTDEHQGDVT